MLFGEWIDFWYQNYKKLSLRPSTQAAYENVIYKHIIALAYPMYNVIVKRERKKIAPEIIRLTDELMKG